MDAASLSALVADMFLTINLLSGYPVPEGQPAVTRVSRETMQAMICQGPCAVRAFYTPEKGVYIDEKLNLADDYYARSVLMHELVHHLQHVAGRFEDLDTPCRRWKAKEVEAYEIQHKYLKKLRLTQRFIALDTVPITCPGDDDPG